MTIKAKRKLTDFSFEDLGSHIALVGPAVGGAANGRTTLILKATNDITDTDVKEHLTSVEKAKFYQELRNTLEEKLREHFKESLEYNWLYLEDFNDSVVVFGTDGNLYTCGYSMGNDDTYTFDAVAKEVDVKRVYEETKDGEVILSDTAMEAVESGVLEMLQKSLSNPETVNRASTLLKSIQQKEIKKMDEIQKAVDAAKAEAGVQIADLQKQVADLVAKVEGYVVAEKAAKQASREVALTELVGAEKAVAVAKGAEALTDEGFTALVESLKAVKAVDTDLLKQASGQGDTEDKQGSKTAELLKARYAQQ
jgi:hypothetical protein